MNPFAYGTAAHEAWELERAGKELMRMIRKPIEDLLRRITCR